MRKLYKGSREVWLRGEAAILLHDQGYTHREIGVIMGVSYQRVHQLIVRHAVRKYKTEVK